MLLENDNDLTLEKGESLWITINGLSVWATSAHYDEGVKVQVFKAQGEMDSPLSEFIFSGE